MHEGGDPEDRKAAAVVHVRQYLGINAIDEIHLAVSPVILGRGEALLPGIDLPRLGFKVTEHPNAARDAHRPHEVVTGR